MRDDTGVRVGQLIDSAWSSSCATRLSVNLNKVALLRNARSHGRPSVLEAADIVLEAGAHGITVHPRPDQRHIRTHDVRELAHHLRGIPGVELNVEGNPFPEFMELVRETMPDQCTLVPDAPDARTSDHGWDLEACAGRLEPIIAELRALGIRVSLFMDPDRRDWQLARDLGADRVELYTEGFAVAHAQDQLAHALAVYGAAARNAQAAGLGVNAGHDLDLYNLAALCSIPGILEVSIGHALIADALVMGLDAAVRAYLKVLSGRPATAGAWHG
jgi:pyridoxine 5-phosphate synthase